MHNRPGLLPLLLALALAACGPDPADPVDAVLDRAVEALGGGQAVRSVSTLRVRMERAEPASSDALDVAVVEYLLAPPDRLARRTEAAGLVRRSAIDGDRMWLRSGAAVRNLTGPAAADEAALRDDLLCLLAEPLRGGPFDLAVEPRADGAPAVRITRPGGAARVLVLDAATGLPARVERLASDGSGKVVGAWDYAEFAQVAGRGSLLFPRRMEEQLGETSSSWHVTAVSLGDGSGAAGLRFVRPNDAGPGTFGEITRRSIAASNAVAVEREGPLTDLARVDRAIEHALEVSHAARRGPTVRVFTELPNEAGVATVTTYVPVRLSRDPHAGNLPRGIEARVIDAADFLAVEYRGPYPRDRSVYAPLEQRASELGLVPAGAPRHVILSDPEEGDPSDLRQEILLPVREAD